MKQSEPTSIKFPALVLTVSGLCPCGGGGGCGAPGVVSQQVDLAFIAFKHVGGPVMFKQVLEGKM